ncbi:Uu.00g024160.m01.CDS01 [Anthostomella pinea]|uniref:Uu.00g024160.m01.CDS01 n=1 Tax=Anthostomella pinea TaxID=933095 RepID=A0AAI8YP09_9PEZI|nr:Uu.00g024160.m01.CDS01 [Anthostomella pinea]
MGRPPAYIFVVRHGKRLDAADKQWHLTSPTPYDPPLTYGGWMQSRTVGARIASILREREAEDAFAAEAAAHDRVITTSVHPRKKRRYRVVLHSSPFLRCVQTSIAISAGIASNPPSSAAPAEILPPPTTLPQTRASTSSNPAPTPSQPSIPTPDCLAHPSSDLNQHIHKCVLRLDPFLGEWLSPDYFEHITPPPKSGLMLATAKAELLRRENYNDYPHFHARHVPHLSTQLWNASPRRGSALAVSMTPDSIPASGVNATPSLTDGVPGHKDSSNGVLEGRRLQAASEDHSSSPGYTGPVPSYALSSSEPIPKGYVAHARDACVDVDYQWDSTRDYLGWGNGGVLPEEWAAMHQRFRRGLRRMVDWYGTTENPGEMVTKTPMSPSSENPPNESRRKSEQDNSAVEDAEDVEDVEIEDVVILVSHGAGCNALVGAITQQPVLADVAMSSLSMARRRTAFDHADLSQEISALSLDEALPRNCSSMPDMYELKLFASTEHLRTVITPPTISRSSSIAGATPRGRPSTGYSSALKEIRFGAAYGETPVGSRSNSANASLGSMRRSSGGPALVLRPSLPNNANKGGITVGSGVSSFSPTRPNRSGLWGLWTPNGDEGEAENEPEPPMLLDFSHEVDAKQRVDGAHTKDDAKKSNSGVPEPPTPPKPTDQKHGSEVSHDEEHDTFDEDSVPHLWAGTGNGGLWGAPRPPGEAERLRDFSASKRRWTVTER